MHPLITLAAGHAAKAAPLTPLAAAVTALIVATVVLAVLKIIAKALTPKKKTAERPASPYSAPAGRR